MIFVESLIKTLKKNSIEFFTGVPDSVLKHLSSYLKNYTKKDFSFIGGFVSSGIIIAFIASIILLISSMMGYPSPILMLGLTSAGGTW